MWALEDARDELKMLAKAVTHTPEPDGSDVVIECGRADAECVGAGEGGVSHSLGNAPG